MQLTKMQVLKAIEATLDETNYIDIHADDYDSEDLELIGSSQSLVAAVLTRKLNEIIEADSFTLDKPVELDQ